jgi:hypothetical protein
MQKKTSEDGQVDELAGLDCASGDFHHLISCVFRPGKPLFARHRVPGTLNGQLIVSNTKRCKPNGKFLYRSFHVETIQSSF